MGSITRTFIIRIIANLFTGGGQSPSGEVAVKDSVFPCYVYWTSLPTYLPLLPLVSSLQIAAFFQLANMKTKEYPTSNPGIWMSSFSRLVSRCDWKVEQRNKVFYDSKFHYHQAQEGRGEKGGRNKLSYLPPHSLSLSTHSPHLSTVYCYNHLVPWKCLFSVPQT